MSNFTACLCSKHGNADEFDYYTHRNMILFNSPAKYVCYFAAKQTSKKLIDVCWTSK